MAQGLDKIPLRIPAQWDAAWFERFVRDVLAKADVRNATGIGVSIEGQSSDNATIALGDEALALTDADFLLAEANSLLPNSRTVTVEPGVLSATDSGPGGTLALAVVDHGLNLQKLVPISSTSVLANAASSGGSVDALQATADGQILVRTSGALGFSLFTADMATGTQTSGNFLALSGATPTWAAPAALTKTDDTNVTLTLGGSPTTALMAAASLTLGWTGSLAATRGGTGTGTFATGDMLYASATNTLSKRGIGTEGYVLTVQSGVPAWASVTGGGGTGSEAAYASAILALTPTGYWKLNETSGTTLADSSGGAYDMTTTGTPLVSDAYIAGHLSSKYMGNNASGQNGGAITSNLGLTAPLTSDWSVQAVILRRTTGDIYMFAMGAAGETEAANYQVEFSVIGGLLSLFWENGAGTNVFVSSVTTVPVGVPVHVAATKNAASKIVTFYLNGKKVGTTSYSTEVTGGTGTLITHIGLDVTQSSAPYTMAHVSFHYGVLFTETQVQGLAIYCGLY